MMTDQIRPEEDEYQRARKRAEDIQGLYLHVIVYLVINAGLFGINWLTTGGDGPWWAFWPLLGWGIGVVVHMAATFLPVFSPGWVDRRAARMVGRR